jgi:hypothetical protein
MGGSWCGQVPNAVNDMENLDHGNKYCVSEYNERLSVKILL